MDESKERASWLIYSGSSILLLDAPKRSVYGVIFGLFLYVIYFIIFQIGKTGIALEYYHFMVIGVFTVNIKTIVDLSRGKSIISEKYEEKFEVLRRAEEEGLSKAHIKIQLLEICKSAVNDTAIDDEVLRQISEIRTQNQSQE